LTRHNLELGINQSLWFSSSHHVRWLIGHVKTGSCYLETNWLIRLSRIGTAGYRLIGYFTRYWGYFLFAYSIYKNSFCISSPIWKSFKRPLSATAYSKDLGLIPRRERWKNVKKVGILIIPALKCAENKPKRSLTGCLYLRVVMSTGSKLVAAWLEDRKDHFAISWPRYWGLSVNNFLYIIDFV